MLLHPFMALAIKRLLDIVLSVVALAIVFPIMKIAAVSIKLSSPGPIVYRGVRAGLKGRPFHIVKFRTMVADAENLGGPTTGTNDPRITRIGAFLRQTKIDELPQFINVLKGDMSVVGPRPEVLLVTGEYSEDEEQILQMRPGITDLASIEYISLNELVGNDDPYVFFREHILPKKNALRLEYVRNWSLRLDFWLLYKTVIAVIKKIYYRL